MEELRQQLQQVQGEVDAAKQRYNNAWEQLQVSVAFVCLTSNSGRLAPQQAAFVRWRDALASCIGGWLSP